MTKTVVHTIDDGERNMMTTDIDGAFCDTAQLTTDNRELGTCAPSSTTASPSGV